MGWLWNKRAPGISASRMVFPAASKDMLQHRDEKLNIWKQKTSP